MLAHLKKEDTLEAVIKQQMHKAVKINLITNWGEKKKPLYVHRKYLTEYLNHENVLLS